MLTAITTLLTVLWGLGSINLISLNEGRRALAIKEMFASGNWLLPTLNGELYLTKPPLLYWISVGFSALFGQVNEWTLRLPSALAALATLWMSYRYTFKKFGAWSALFAAQILIANVGFAMLARRVEIEMLLTALCVGALIAALEYIEAPAKRAWIYASYFLLALAVLSKGPVAMLFVTLPLIVAAVWTKDSSIRQLLTNLTGWGIFLLVSLSWYAAVTWQLGFDIWATIAKRDILEKIQAADTAKPFLSYFGWIAVDFLLLVGLLLIRPKALFKHFADKNEWKVIITAVLIPLLVFSLFSNKHAKYLLPIYPLIAIILGVQLGSIIETATARIRLLILSLGVLLPIIFACFYMLVEARYFAYRTSVFPQFQTWSKSISTDTLYTFGNMDSRLIYYANKPVKALDEAQIKTYKDENKSFLLLIEDENMSKVSVQMGCKMKEFKPYLKKKKALLVLGFGSACNTKVQLN